METIHEQIQEHIGRAVRATYSDIDLDITVQHPQDMAHGDYTTSIALVIAQQTRARPRDVAEKIVAALQKNKIESIDRMDIAGPGFINFWLTDAWLERAAASINQNGATAFMSDEGNGKTVIVEYSSVNVAKEMGIGHLRSTIIGDALARLYAARGFTVVRDNHLGDWGTQMGFMLVAFAREGKTKPEDIASLSVTDFVERYVAVNQAAESDPTIRDAARQATKALQDGDTVHRALWEALVRTSHEYFKTVYDRLGVSFDTEYGESFYHDRLAGVVRDAREKGVAVESEGAMIIPFAEEGFAPFMIQKNDGGYGYATTDLATVQYRAETYAPALVLYVVGNEQSLHFSQLFRAVALLGYPHTGTLVHVKFGLMLGSDGKKFSTRRGKAVAMETIIDEVVARARAIPTLATLPANERDAIAEIVGIGALKYFDLSQCRTHDITFDPERMLSLTGNSAPYLQYVAVRIRSILAKAGEVHAPQSETRTMEWHTAERDLYRMVYRLPEVMTIAGDTAEPHRLADYLYRLATLFHVFYEHVPVLQAAEEQRTERLQLISAVRTTLVYGLSLLGIEVPERM